MCPTSANVCDWRIYVVAKSQRPVNRCFSHQATNPIPTTKVMLKTKTEGLPLVNKSTTEKPTET